MNIYEKLQNCRVDLQNMNLKKSGENKFAGYDYFELQDFLPYINELFKDNKLFSQVSFTQDMATLTIVNSEKPEETIIFTSPMATAQLKGCHDIQNLGAVESYQRRYLYLAALEIVESDALDKTTGNQPAAAKTNQTTKSKAATDPASNTQKGGMLCDDGCGTSMAPGVVSYCQNNSERFKGKIVCPSCQKNYPAVKK